MLALQAVGVAAQLVLAVAREARDRVHELLERVLAGARLVQDVVHDSILRDVALRLPTAEGRVKGACDGVGDFGPCGTTRSGECLPAVGNGALSRRYFKAY